MVCTKLDIYVFIDRISISTSSVVGDTMSRLFQGLVVFVVIHVYDVFACPVNCTCSASLSEAKCADKELTVIPNEIPTVVTSL